MSRPTSKKHVCRAGSHRSRLQCRLRFHAASIAGRVGTADCGRVAALHRGIDAADDAEETAVLDELLEVADMGDVEE